MLIPSTKILVAGMWGNVTRYDGMFWGSSLLNKGFKPKFMKLNH